MAYDETLASRIREALAITPGVTARKMSGGIAFMLRGNMCCGVTRDEFMAHVGAEQYVGALARPHARPMDFTNRPMKGMLYVAPPGVARDADLGAWIERCTRFAGALPPKG